MQTTQNQEEIKIKEYINKYIKELQRHFEIPDKKMCEILRQVYKDLAPANFIDNSISVVKSFYDKNFKRKI